MKYQRFILSALLVIVMFLDACAPAPTPTPTAAPPTQTAVPPSPTVTFTPTPTLPPEVNVAIGKPVRVSSSWMEDPPQDAVDGSESNWWGAEMPPPAWIEVDLQGVYTISRIKVHRGSMASGSASYKIWGRGPDNQMRELHTFKYVKSGVQQVEHAPVPPWENISTIRVEVLDTSGWAGVNEIKVYSRWDPQVVEAPDRGPIFSRTVETGELDVITADNAILLEEVSRLGRGQVNQLAVSPDGSMLAAATNAGVWLYNTALPGDEPRLLEGHERAVLAVTFTPDGETLLSGSQDGTVRKWDPATGKLLDTYELWSHFEYEATKDDRPREVWSIAFSPNGSFVAAGAFGGTVRLWNLQTRMLWKEITHSTKTIISLAFSTNNEHLAVSSVDAKLVLYNVKDGAELAAIDTSRIVMLNLTFSPDGSMLAASGSDGLVHRWHAVSGELLDGLVDPDGGFGLAFSANSRYLVSGDKLGYLRLWDQQEATVSDYATTGSLFTAAVFHPDGRYVFIASLAGDLLKWDLVAGKVGHMADSHLSAVNSLAFSPDGTLLALGLEDGSVRLWDPAKNKPVAFFWGHSSRVTGVAFSPDGKLVASGSFDGFVRLWDAASGEALQVLRGHTSLVRCVAFSPDGRYVASGSTDETARVWDTATGEVKYVLEGHSSEIQSLKFSPDGAWLATASTDATLRFWAMDTGKARATLKENYGYLVSLDFSPDGSVVAFGGGSVWMYVKNLVYGSAAVSGTTRFPDKGHPGWIQSIAFSTGGDLIAVASLMSAAYWIAPGEVHLYNAATGYPQNLLRGHLRRVVSVDFSPDGRLLATGSADGTVRLWGVRFGALAPGQTVWAAAPTRQPTTPVPTQEWTDPFDGSLAEGWRWVNGPESKWNLSDREGYLRVDAATTNSLGSTYLLRDVPEGDYALTTHLIFQPQTNFQSAGLMIYQDERNYLALVRAYCDRQGVCVGNGIYFDQVAGGEFAANNHATGVTSLGEIYLRLEFRGPVMTAFSSLDGVTWQEIGSHLVPAGFRPVGIGLVTGGALNPGDPAIQAYFDYFTLTQGAAGEP